MQQDFSIVIIDADETATSHLIEALSDYPLFHVRGEARNGYDGYDMVLKTQPDVIFLEVELPDMRGAELLQKLKDKTTWKMVVVFYTAHEKYLLHLFRESPFDCLLKPIDRNYLTQIVHRLLEEPYFSPAEKHIRALTSLDNIFIVSSGANDLKFIRPENIGLFKYIASGKWEVYLDSVNKPVLLKKRLNAEAILSCSSCFVQIHQSYIINIHYLRMVKDKKCILYPPFEHITELTFSKQHIKKLQEKFIVF